MIQDTIKQRLRDSLLVASSRKTVVDTAAHLAGEITEEGTWGDLDDWGEPRGPSTRGGQLVRTLLMAKARHLAPGEFDDPARRGLDWWLARDLHGEDSRQDQIVVPSLVGEIALLCEDDLSLGAWGKVLEILARSRWAEWKDGEGWVEWTGGFLLGVAYVSLLRGCLEKSTTLCETAFRRAFRNVRWSSSCALVPGAGVEQAPSSGLALAQDYARLIALAYGTPWQAPTDRVKAFVGFLLDFQQWTMRQGIAHSADADAIPLGATVDLRALGESITQLAQLGNPPRRSELVALAERLLGKGKPLCGHRYFARSRFAVHQRPAFYASLRLTADETVHHDVAPEGAPAAAGTLYFLRSGDEYVGLSRIWKSRQLPGLTAVQSALRRLPPDETPDHRQRLSAGISEGDYGMAALELVDDGLRAKKSWFFFDDVVACLDAGIQGPPVNEPVYTSVNQCRLRGSVTVENGHRQRVILPRGQAHDLTASRWVEHDGMRYYFPGSLHVTATLDTDLGRDAASSGSEGVFTLLINHGLKPSGASSAYLVGPADDSLTSSDLAQVEILSNTPTVQAARHRGSRIFAAAFWEAGTVSLPDGGRIAANRPCVLMCREDLSGHAALNLANPSRSPATIHVEYGGRCFAFDLPGGEGESGSISRRF